MSEQTEPARPGRKRSQESRQAILRAAFEIVAEQGYPALTVERMAVRSGVGKQTVYRWWPGKADVLLEALGLKADLYIPAPDLGDFEADLRAFLEATFTLARDPRIVAVLQSLMAEAQVDQGFGERFRSSFLQSRREALGQILERAETRGDLPGNVMPETVIDVVFGILWYRLLADHRPVDDRLVDELLQLLGHSRPESVRSRIRS